MKEFIWPVRVYYEDTDLGKVVYYANYLKFYERARTEWLRSCGVEQDRLLAEQGLIFAVRAVEVKYLKPAVFNDELQVTCSIEKVGRASLDVKQRLLRGDEQLSHAQIKLASLDSDTLKPRPMGAELYQLIIEEHQ